MCRLAPQPPARLVKKKGGKIDRNYSQKELNDQVDASSKAAAKKAVKDAKKVWEKAQKVKEDTQVAAEIPQQHTGHCSAGKKSLETGNADIEFNEDAIREDAVRCYQESREFIPCSGNLTSSWSLSTSSKKKKKKKVLVV